MSKEKLRKKLQKIVESIGAIEPVALFDSDQWEVGNTSIKRIDKSLSSLNVNIRLNSYLAGIDGKNKGDIFDMLKREFEPNNDKLKNKRFKVPFERIEEVVRYYAGVKKENMKKILFCRITSMKYYQNLDGDTQQGGGSYTKDNPAHERFNFKERDGVFKGFVESSSETKGMNLTRIDPAIDKNSDIVTNVLVIFVANSCIVGYYKDAKIYASIQDKNNYDEGEYSAYNIKTQSKAVLLSQDGRNYEIPKGKGAMGQSNVFYIYDDKGNLKQDEWIQKAIDYVRIN